MSDFGISMATQVTQLTALPLPPLFINDHLLCFIMQNLPPSDLLDENFLIQTCGTGE